MTKPLILINCKTYPEAAGKKALKIAQQIAQVKNTKYRIVIAPSLLTLQEIAGKVKIPIFAQHADPFSFGAHTGSIPIQELKSLGITGTLLNHSERKIPLTILQKIVHLCRKEKIITVVCASSLAEVQKVASLHPDYLAYEPPELIGGNVSVTKAKPEIIATAVRLVRSLSPSTKVLCGAGVQSAADVQKALELGTSGVLIAHAVVKAKNPKRMVERMLE
ncbi:MAG: triose-phosphate isomerase [Nanoarchaeota archaeon]|nr:triose-phosphate isomerase [Nanoarchaeota archaeon]